MFRHPPTCTSNVHALTNHPRKLHNILTHLHSRVQHIHSPFASRKIPVLYLPKTRPSVPSLIELPPLEQDMTSERVKAVQLAPRWPGTCQAQNLTSQGTEIPTVHVRQIR